MNVRCEQPLFVDPHIIHHSDLSWQAKGLYAYLQSLADEEGVIDAIDFKTLPFSDEAHIAFEELERASVFQA